VKKGIHYEVNIRIDDDLKARADNVLAVYDAEGSVLSALRTYTALLRLSNLSIFMQFNPIIFYHI